MSSLDSAPVFRPALPIAETHTEVTIEYVLSLTITAVPIALFHEDGVPWQTNKAELGHVLEHLTDSKTVQSNLP